MKIGALQKFSLIDYPGKVCAIIFTVGCNFRCGYCHNPELVDPKQFPKPMPEEKIISFLQKRKGKLEAITITGGEPTLQPDLLSFLEQVKRHGYLVKLDTNGTNPNMLQQTIKDKLVDYIAMDIKGPLDRYREIVLRCPASLRRQVPRRSPHGKSRRRRCGPADPCRTPGVSPQGTASCREQADECHILCRLC